MWIKDVIDWLSEPGASSNESRHAMDQEFEGYGYMKRVYGIDRLPDVATVAKLSITDTLTSAYNRLAFESFITSEISKANRYKSPLTTVLLGIDGFKQINSEQGHMVGNFILQELADLLKNYIRTSDMLFRWGGDEFLILMPHTDMNGAGTAIAKIEELIAVHDFNGVHDIQCTIIAQQYSKAESLDTYIMHFEDILRKEKEKKKRETTQ